ncbi:MAG: hypothetical protein CRN43_22880 [Candidatus Nephrothrix sp. EaCA]|nr:MAG: hypothetical protein CRN43_22880 [Candidatus Nephrothrix sp. EaCA]
MIATYVPTVPQPPIFTLPSAQYMDYLGYIILGLFVLIILRKLCKCRAQRFASSPDFAICLEIKAPGRCFFLTIQKVSGCPTDYAITGTTLSSHIGVQGWFRPYVFITWGDLQLVQRTSRRPILLVTKVPISLLTRFTLASVVTNPYECFLFFAHAGRGTYVTTFTNPSAGIGRSSVLLVEDDA